MSIGRTIHLLNKSVTLNQPEGGFQTSIDAVLLAAAAPVKAGQSVLDLGCGVGAAGLCVAQRVNSLAALAGLELLPREAALARENAALNGVSMQVIEGDVRRWRPASADQRFDHVICNPPYLEAGAHLSSPDVARAHAMGHVEADTALEDWVLCALEALKPKGCLTLIHRADALAEILGALDRRFGAVEVIPLWPKTDGRPAKRVIVRAVKGRRASLSLHPGLVLHEADGRYTQAAEAILRDGQRLL